MKRLFIYILAAIAPGCYSFAAEPAKHVNYDSKHRITSETSNGARTEYKYEDKITIKTYGIIIPDTTIEIYTYKDGLCQQIKTTKNGQQKSVEQFYYHGRTLDSSVVTYNYNKTLKLYDEKGHLRMEENGDGDVVNYKCDDAGNIIEIKEDGYKQENTYDKKGRQTSVIWEVSGRNRVPSSEKMNGTIKELPDGWEITYKKSGSSSQLTEKVKKTRMEISSKKKGFIASSQKQLRLQNMTKTATKQE